MNETARGCLMNLCLYVAFIFGVLGVGALMGTKPEYGIGALLVALVSGLIYASLRSERPEVERASSTGEEQKEVGEMTKGFADMVHAAVRKQKITMEEGKKLLEEMRVLISSGEEEDPERLIRYVRLTEKLHVLSMTQEEKAACARDLCRVVQEQYILLRHAVLISWLYVTGRYGKGVDATALADGTIGNMEEVDHLVHEHIERKRLAAIEGKCALCVFAHFFMHLDEICDSGHDLGIFVSEISRWMMERVSSEEREAAKRNMFAEFELLSFGETVARACEADSDKTSRLATGLPALVHIVLVVLNNRLMETIGSHSSIVS